MRNRKYLNLNPVASTRNGTCRSRFGTWGGIPLLGVQGSGFAVLALSFGDSVFRGNSESKKESIESKGNVGAFYRPQKGT